MSLWIEVTLKSVTWWAFNALVTSKSDFLIIFSRTWDSDARLFHWWHPMPGIDQIESDPILGSVSYLPQYNILYERPCPFRDPWRPPGRLVRGPLWSVRDISTRWSRPAETWVRSQILVVWVGQNWTWLYWWSRGVGYCISPNSESRLKSKSLSIYNHYQPMINWNCQSP